MHLQVDATGDLWVRKHCKATLIPGVYRSGAYDLAEREVLCTRLARLAGIPAPESHVLGKESNIVVSRFAGTALFGRSELEVVNPNDLIGAIVFGHWVGDDDDRRLEHVLVDAAGFASNIDWGLTGIGHPTIPEGQLLTGRLFGDLSKLQKCPETRLPYQWVDEYLESHGVPVTRQKLVESAERIERIEDEEVDSLVREFQFYSVGRHRVITAEFSAELIRRKHRLVKVFQCFTPYT